MDRLADAIASQTAAILAAVGSAASPSTVTLDATAVAALATRQRPTDINGQRVRPADFDRNKPDPPDDTFALPAEPKNPVDHGIISKNENHLIQWVATNRIDPRFGSRQFFDDRIRNHVNSPFKLAVFDHPSYEDYARGTSIFYDAMRVWHARLAPGGSLHHLVDDASPRTIWNLHMKKLQHVKDEAYTDPTHGFTAQSTSPSRLQFRLANCILIYMLRLIVIMFRITRPRRTSWLAGLILAKSSRSRSHTTLC